MRWSGRTANALEWSGEIINREKKQNVADRIAREVSSGSVIGIGSGSTVFLALQAIARRIKEEGLRVTGIPTSAEAELTCTVLGIPTTTLLRERPDWGLDGADEVDPMGRLIKGRGGAMFKEKLVISSSPKTYIIVDDTKLVETLGEKFPVPLEVYPGAINFVEEQLKQFNDIRDVRLRLAKAKDGPVITESGNFILDVRFSRINSDLEKKLKSLCGVIESGLFVNYPLEILVSG